MLHLISSFLHLTILHYYFTQKPKFNNMHLADIKKNVPSDFWLVDKSCHAVLCLIVHRKNNEFTKKAMSESAVTVAQQKKGNSNATQKERAAVKERAMVMAKAAVNPAKMKELQIQEKVASEHVATSKQKRIEKKLHLLAKFQAQMSPDEYKRKVRKQLDKLDSSDDESLQEPVEEEVVNSDSDEEE